MYILKRQIKSNYCKITPYTTCAVEVDLAMTMILGRLAGLGTISPTSSTRPAGVSGGRMNRVSRWNGIAAVQRHSSLSNH